MKKQFLGITLIGLFMSSVLLNGCGKSDNTAATAIDSAKSPTTASAKSIVLSAYLFNVDKREALEKTFKSFSEKNPDIKVELVVNDKDYYSVLKPKSLPNKHRILLWGNMAICSN
ncbi:hypothetical protein [Paenibacillus sp. N3.4]|uniref:hypothetical protein n=1 Tax=Paenibacillus sp. N3.4 TaxID=2603222 RepID=UPI0011CAC428|nr:hypothetical protein [Paenibacillus sp. N3.4]TXK84563.1 hypothetical protein FU659_08045 [Paenibacillus sp. N3.4]